MEDKERSLKVYSESDEVSQMKCYLEDFPGQVLLTPPTPEIWVHVGQVLTCALA